MAGHNGSSGRAGQDKSGKQSPPHDAEPFLTAFDAFVQAVRRARGAATAQNGGLTLSQYALLSRLAERRSARVRDLAADAGITASTATRILDTLERRRVVDRARAPQDRRTVTVTLTGEGRKLLRDQDAWLQARQADFFSRLPAEERELAPDLLMRLATLIDELAAGP